MGAGFGRSQFSNDGCVEPAAAPQLAEGRATRRSSRVRSAKRRGRARSSLAVALSVLAALMGVGVLPAVTGKPLVAEAAGSSTLPGPTVASGDQISIALKNDGTVWDWGNNTSGSLGIGTTTGPQTCTYGSQNTPCSTVPVQVSGLTGVVSVGASGGDGMAVKSDGTVWDWGGNGNGGLGDNQTFQHQSFATTPVEVSGAGGTGTFSGGVEVVGGQATSYALRSDGTVWAWGSNQSGEFGNGVTGGISDFPVEASIGGVQEIAAANATVYALKTDGTVWSWGWGVNGELGNGQSGAYTESNVPVQVVGISGTATAVTSIGAGGMALTNSGSVYTWGYNGSGELGNGTSGGFAATATLVPNLGPVVRIGGTGGENNAGAILANGQTYSWGDNTCGQLGIGSQSGGCDATVTCPDCSDVPVATSIGSGVELSIGNQSVMELDATGSVWGWGWNIVGQVGNGTYTTSGCRCVTAPTISLMTGVMMPPPLAGGPPASAGPRGSELYGKENPGEAGGAFCLAAGDVNCVTGNLVESADDLLIPGHGRNLDFNRTYNSRAATAGASGMLGYGWSSSYAIAATIVGSLSTAGSTVTITQENGSTVQFTSLGGSPATFVSPSWVIGTLAQSVNGQFLFYTLPGNILDTFSATSGQLVSLSERYQYVTSLTDVNGQLTTVADPEGRTFTFAYNGAGQLSSVTDQANPPRQVTYGYDSNGNLQTVKDVNGYTVTYGYNASHALTSITDGRSHQIQQIFYTGSSQVDHTIDALNNTTGFAYTTSGPDIVITVTHPLGDQTVYTTLNNKAISVTRGGNTPAAATWNYYYDYFGNVAQTIDPNGKITYEQYDQYDNLVFVTDALRRTTSYSYSAFPNTDVLTVTDPIGNTTKSNYNSAGELLSTVKPGGITTTYTYGDTSHPDQATAVTDPDGFLWNFGYDSYGDRTTVADPFGDTTTTYYDIAGRFTGTEDARKNTTVVTPDGFGRPVKTTDPLNQATFTSYDADGNLSSVDDAMGNLTTYTYNADNEQTGVNRAGGSATSETFDADGRMASQCDGKNNCTTYSYDGQNRLATITDPLNRTTTYHYDGAGRLMSILDATNLNTTYTYDDAGELMATTYSDRVTPNVSYTYDNDGHRKTMSDGSGATTYMYNALSQLTQVSNGAGAVIKYGYNKRGEVTAITYPNQSVVTQGYDIAGRMDSVRDWNNLNTYYGYDADNHLATVNYANGIGAAYGYNNADVLTSISDKTSGGTTLASFTYTRNADNQVATSVPTGVPGGSDSYTYTPLTQIGTDNSASYSFDNADNLTQIPGSSSTTINYDTANELIGTTGGTTASYTFNNRGDRTSKTVGSTTTTYSFDEAGRMTGAGSTLYGYNGDGVRVSKTAGRTSESYTYDPMTGNLLVDGTTNFIYGPAGPLEEITGGNHGVTSFYLQDQMGSTRLLTTATGSIADSYTYNPVGTVLGSTGSVSNPLQFQGQYLDPETGFYYLRARYYDPTTGQFLSRDPKDVRTRSAYGYALGDPINGSDPSGQFSVNLPFGLCLSFGNDPGCKPIIDNKTAGLALAAAAGATACILACPIAATLLAGGEVAAAVGGEAAISSAASATAAEAAGTEAVAGAAADVTATDATELTGTNAIGQVTSRSSFRVGTIQSAWDDAASGADGAKLCPACGDEVSVPPNSGVPRDWDINHNPPWSVRTFPTSVTRQEVIDAYQQDIELMCPACNRSGSWMSGG